MTTVLVVDDRPVNRDLVRTILGYEGYDVVEAESGPEALRLISQGRPDQVISLVISDVLMPGMDGYELAREIRSSAESRELPIVFYTANYLEQEARPIAAACGVEHIVAKDGDPRALVNAVTQALHRDRAKAPPEIVDEDFSREHLRVLNAKLLEKVRELEEKEQLGKLVDAAIVVSGDLGLQTTLNRVASTARALVSAQLVTVLLCDDAGYEIGAAHDGTTGTPAASASRLSLTITAKDGQHGTLEAVGKIGGERFSDNDRRVLNSLTEAAAVALANAHRYDDARRRQAWLRAAAEITALLLGGDPAEALPTVVARARTVANAAVAWIEPATSEGQAAGGALGRSAASQLGAQLLERVATAGAPVLVQDASTELPATEPAGDTVADLDGIGPLLAVPMQAREDLLGVLILANRRHRRPFTALDVEMATTFAGQAAVAVEFARARTDRERLHVVEERHRIARDLHDIVIQRLFATGLRLESMASTLPEPQAEAVREATTELDRTIDDIREAIFSLRSASQPPLRRQLANVISRIQRTLGFAPTVLLDDALDDAVPEQLWPLVIATTTEALTNIAKHAEARRAEVVITVDGDELVVMVSDDGRGLPVARLESGLSNLRRRAELAGGHMVTAAGDDGHGLVLTSRVPLPA